jgi:uncharacterized protein (DUF2336 family)
MSTITPPELQGLLAIAREEGLDMKPVLLRVLTDLYVSAPVHSPEEVAQFREIAGTMIAGTDTDTALIVACKLCDYPNTPVEVGEALLARQDDASRIVLADAPWLPRRHAIDTAAGPDRILAAAVAARADLDPELARLLLNRDDPLIDVTLAANTAAAFPRDVIDELLARSREEGALAAALLSRTDLAGADRAVRYLDADKAGRRAIIEEAERHAALTGRHLPNKAAPDDVIVPLEKAAMAGDQQAFRAILALALGVTPQKADRLLTDRSGEALALALVALGIPDDVSTRIFMFRDPLIGHSTERCFALVNLSRRVSQRAAERIIGAVLGLPGRLHTRPGSFVPANDPAERGNPGSQSHHSQAFAEVRRALGS